MHGMSVGNKLMVLKGGAKLFLNPRATRTGEQQNGCCQNYDWPTFLLSFHP